MIIGPLLLSAALAVRQPPAPSPPIRRAYGQVSLFVSHHPANGDTYPPVDARLGGDAWTLSAGAGGWLSRSIGLEGEIVYGGLVSAPQQRRPVLTRYYFTEDYIAQNRDVLLNELVRYRPGGGGKLQIVAGSGLAVTTAREASGVSTSVPPTPVYGPTQLPDLSTTLHAFTITGGLDATLPVSSRVALTPTFRLRWIRRPVGGASGWNGIGPYVFQFGVGIRIE
ncbi:MAG TPA: hypothetical protein VF921_07875 [Vicinamibacterales bacterium]